MAEINKHPVRVPECFSHPCSDILTALSDAQAKMEDAEKNQEATITASRKYDYSDLSSVYAVFRKIIGEVGLSVVVRFPVDKSAIHIILAHDSGQWIDYGEYPLGNAEKHQDRGSALTYARRYALAAVWGIAPKGDDDDGKAGNDSLGKPAPRHVNKVFNTAAERNRFCDEVIKSFEAATTLEELQQRVDILRAKLDSMKDGEESDKLAVAELQQRYNRAAARIKAIPPAPVQPPARRTVEDAGRTLTPPTIPIPRNTIDDDEKHADIPYR